MKRLATHSFHRLAGGLIIALVAMGVRYAEAADTEALLGEAIREYRSALDCPDRDERLERFHRAELLFSQLAAEPGRGNTTSPAGIRNADLYVNLGNAALGAERLGAAVLAYRRALLVDPDHRRADQNLRHARTLLPDWVPRPEQGGLLHTFFAWSTRLSSAERRTAAAAAFLAAAALGALAIRWRRPLFRNLALLPAAVWLAFLGTVLVDALRSSGTAGVITVPEVVARAADSIHAPALVRQPLPSGTEVEIVGLRDDWLRVRLADGREAWVPASSVEAVAPP
jgi:hypothetical protein